LYLNLHETLTLKTNQNFYIILIEMAQMRRALWDHWSRK